MNKYGSQDCGCTPRPVVGKSTRAPTTTKAGQRAERSTTSNTGNWTKGGPYRPQSPGSNKGM